MPNETSCEGSEVEEKTDPLASTNVIFGVDKDTALHFCIRNHHHEAAERLIDAGAPVDLENAKGVTPLILAAQTGNLKMIRLLESRGAFESHVTLSGSTAVLQAAHFGHLSVVQHLLRKNHQLLEQANYHQTTPLMRASQEGHLQIVQFLCDMGATVNRKNLQAMTALMLASQRGNAKICRYLIQRGADLDAMTGHTSTSLVLACKRQHLDTVKVLVTAGAELFLKDNRGRTARDIALQRRPFTRNRNDATKAILALLLDPTVQVDLMRKQARRDRSWSWMRLLALIQQDRARLRSAEDVPLHEAIDLIEERRSPPKSTTAWIRTLSLPTPLVQHIAQFAPLPTLWDRRLSLLTGRCVAAPNAALESIFDLMDEVLEESNFLTALDEALVLPPVNFASWRAWKGWCRRNGIELALTSGSTGTQRPDGQQQPRSNSTLTRVPQPADPQSIIQQRRYAGYLQLLSQNSQLLTPILTNSSYQMPLMIVQQLITSNDVCSIIRRFGTQQGCGVEFNASVAMDMLMLVARLCSWYVETS